MLELYTSEPNTFFLKPLIALHEKEVPFESRWMNTDALEQFSFGFEGDTEAHLHLEREGPVLRHDGTLISGSFFMLEYIAETFPGVALMPVDAYDRYRAHASGQFLGAHLGSIVPLLGCAKYTAPRLAAIEPQALAAILARIEPVERRQAWRAFTNGAYPASVLGTLRERLKFPVSRVEATLSQEPWLAGADYSIADIDAFAMLRALSHLEPGLLNPRDTPRIGEWLARIEARPAVRKSLQTSRSGDPLRHYVPGVEPSRWG